MSYTVSTKISNTAIGVDRANMYVGLRKNKENKRKLDITFQSFDPGEFLVKTSSR